MYLFKHKNPSVTVNKFDADITKYLYLKRICKSLPILTVANT